MKASRLIFVFLLASSVAVVQLAAQQTKADQKPIKEKLCKLAERPVGLTDELTCERPSTASQVELLGIVISMLSFSANDQQSIGPAS